MSRTMDGWLCGEKQFLLFIYQSILVKNIKLMYHMFEVNVCYSLTNPLYSHHSTDSEVDTKHPQSRGGHHQNIQGETPASGTWPLVLQKRSIRRFVITEKAPTPFKTLLRHYAKWALTPQSLNEKLGPRRKGPNEQRALKSRMTYLGTRNRYPALHGKH